MWWMWYFFNSHSTALTKGLPLSITISESPPHQHRMSSKIHLLIEDMFSFWRARNSGQWVSKHWPWTMYLCLFEGGRCIISVYIFVKRVARCVMMGGIRTFSQCFQNYTWINARWLTKGIYPEPLLADQPLSRPACLCWQPSSAIALMLVLVPCYGAYCDAHCLAPSVHCCCTYSAHCWCAYPTHYNVGCPNWIVTLFSLTHNIFIYTYMLGATCLVECLLFGTLFAIVTPTLLAVVVPILLIVVVPILLTVVVPIPLTIVTPILPAVTSGVQME